MKHKLHLSIPSPCHENWGDMDPTQQGAFCHSCRKEVIDFSAMTDAQVIRWLQQHDTGCGRFRADQLDRDMSLPIVNDSPLRWKVLLMSLWPALSLTTVPVRAATASLNRVPQKSETISATAHSKPTKCDNVKTGICGRVTGEWGEGMTAAHVIVTDNQRHTTDSVVTDIDGTFAIPLPEPGVVTIGINAPGYIAQTLTHIKAGHPYLTIQMKHDPLIIDQVVVSGNLRRTPAQKIRSWFRRTFHRRDQKG